MPDPPSPALESVLVENVSKTFRMPQERVHTLKERALHPLRRRRIEDFHALVDVEFDVKQGEFFGIVGRNGSGKSTLLKCLAGIYATDAGRVFLRGRVATFIELGVGFNTELTARDNVIINAIMLGLTPAEARRRYDSVIEFAELEEFQDLKLKNYSSGMFVRLAFATMIQVDADILLIDEVLAVGDVSFQHKCHDVLQQIRARGRTILFVTHDMPTVEVHCDRALLLEKGRLKEAGEPNRISALYDQLNFKREADTGEDALRRGDGKGEVLDAWVEDEHGLRTATVERGRPCSIHVVAELREAADEPVVGLTMGTEHIPNLFNTSTRDRPGATREGERFEAGERLEMVVEVTLPLAPGRYEISPFIRHRGGARGYMDARDGFASIALTGTRTSTSLVDLAHEVRLERTAVAK